MYTWLYAMVAWHHAWYWNDSHLSIVNPSAMDSYILRSCMVYPEIMHGYVTSCMVAWDLAWLREIMLNMYGYNHTCWAWSHVTMQDLMQPCMMSRNHAWSQDKGTTTSQTVIQIETYWNFLATSYHSINLPELSNSPNSHTRNNCRKQAW